MAFELGAIVAKIKADISDFQSGMAKVSESTSGFRDGLAELGKQAAVFTAAVGAGFTLVAKQALESAAAFEQNRIAFETMLGNADAARALLKEISDFAMATPFELPQLVESSKKLLAYNVAAKDIIPTMKMLGDITSGVGTEKLPQLILAFGQVKAATKLTGAELRQFSEAGVPLLQALVDQANKGGGMLVKVGGAAKGAKVDIGEMNDKLGIAKKRLEEATNAGKAKESTMMSLRNTVQNYEQKLSKANETGKAAASGFIRQKVTAEQMIGLISDGQVKFEDVQKALAGMTAEGGKFFNGMERQSKTFNGVVSNIQDQIGRILRSIMGINEMGDIQEGSLFQKIAQGANAVLQALTNATPMILSAVDQIGNAFNQFMAFIQPLVDWIMANQEIVLEFFKGVAIGLGALLIIGTVAAAISLIMNPLFLLVAAISLLYTAWSTNFLGIQDITNAVFGFISNMITNYLIPAFQMFMTWMNEIFMPAFNQVWNGFIKPIFLDFVNFFKAEWDHIVMIVGGAWEIIKGIVMLVWNFISGYITAGLQILAGDWKGAHETIQNISKNGSEILKGIFNGILSFIGGWGGMLVNVLVAPFEQAWGRIQEYVNKIKDNMDFTKRHSPSVLDIVKSGVHKVNAALGDLNLETNFDHFVPNVQPIGAGVGISPNGQSPAITIDLRGAVIASDREAQRFSKMVGNNIIKSLQNNVRF
jgi:tape measure domain-containing protein